jgi:AAA domain
VSAADTERRADEATYWADHEPGDPMLNGHSDQRVGRLRVSLHSGAAVCDLPPPTPLVAGLLFTPGESVWYAQPKLCKTFLTLSLALSVGTGRPFMGRAVTEGPVLYVAAEGVGGLGARVAAWQDYHQAHDIDRVHFLTTAVNLTERLAVEALAQLAADLDVGLLIVDTLARCAVGAEENSAKDMGHVVESLDLLRDATGHVAVVHHAGKDTSKGMRGSTALLGALDTAVELSGDPTAIKVKVTAQKDAEAAPESYMHLVPHGPSAVIVPVSGVELVTASERAVLHALEALPDEDRTATKWQQMAESMSVSRSVFYEAKKFLLVTGQVSGGSRRGARYTITPAPKEPSRTQGRCEHTLSARTHHPSGSSGASATCTSSDGLGTFASVARPSKDLE